MILATTTTDWLSITFTAVPILASFLALLIGTKFMTKKEFATNKAKRDNWMGALEKRINELETNAKLAAQPMVQVVETVRRMEGKLDEVLKNHGALEKRVLEIEIERRVKNQQDQQGDHRPG